MSTTYENSTFVVDLLDGWELSERPASLAIFRTQDGKGAINLSLMHKREGEDIACEDLIIQFSQGSAVPRTIDCWQTGVRIAYGEGRREGKFWQYWAFCRGRLAVFVSYNCRLENIDDVELAEVQATVRSLRLR